MWKKYCQWDTKSGHVNMSQYVTCHTCGWIDCFSLERQEMPFTLERFYCIGVCIRSPRHYGRSTEARPNLQALLAHGAEPEERTEARFSCFPWALHYSALISITLFSTPLFSGSPNTTYLCCCSWPCPCCLVLSEASDFRCSPRSHPSSWPCRLSAHEGHEALAFSGWCAGQQWGCKGNVA